MKESSRPLKPAACYLAEFGQFELINLAERLILLMVDLRNDSPHYLCQSGVFTAWNHGGTKMEALFVLEAKVEQVS